MADIVGWVGDVLELPIVTLGTVQVTAGLLVAGSMIFAFATGAIKRLRGRA